MAMILQAFYIPFDISKSVSEALEHNGEPELDNCEFWYFLMVL